MVGNWQITVAPVSAVTLIESVWIVLLSIKEELMLEFLVPPASRKCHCLRGISTSVAGHREQTHASYHLLFAIVLSLRTRILSSQSYVTSEGHAESSPLASMIQ